MESVLTASIFPKDMVNLAQRKHTGIYTFALRIQGGFKYKTKVQSLSGRSCQCLLHSLAAMVDILRHAASSPKSMHLCVSQSKKLYSSSCSIRVKELQNKHISLPLRLAVPYGMTPVILLAESLLSTLLRILLLPASEYNSYDMLISFSYLIK